MEYAVLFSVICALYALLWIRTYKPDSYGTFAAHTFVFILLSVLAAYFVRPLFFACVDDSYAYYNICALGLLYLEFLKFFVITCIVCITVNLARTIKCSKQH